jgi:hypothetical protein
VPTSGVTSTYRVTLTSQPIYSYPLAGGDVLAVAQLQTVETDTATSGYLQQDAQRSYWDYLLPGGQYHSVTLHDQLAVVLEVSPSGTARVIGADDGAQSATTTPR